jgi:hypothetical protein
MPLKFTDSTSESEIILEIVDFVQEKNIRYFKLASSTNFEIQVPYIPKEISHWDIEKYEIYLFENPYLTAENDVFEVYEKTIDKRLGWIFPISTLESNESDLVGKKNFDNYRYVAYWKLLKLNISSKLPLNYNEDYRISELFPNIVVCILSKEEMKNIPDFNILNYIFSFFEFDFLLLSDSLKGKAIYNKTTAINNIRKQKKRITLKKSGFDILSNQYIKSLFLEHLYQSEDFLVRYILLYQIVEYFMEEKSNKLLEEEIEDFQNKKITKNSLRENILQHLSERKLIKKIFENISIPNTLKDDFIEKCSYLFNDIGEKPQSSFEDIFYDLRNLITHRFRILTNKTEELKEITSLCEKIILAYLSNYSTS